MFHEFLCCVTLLANTHMVFKHSHAKQVLGEKKIDDKWKVICVHTTTLMLVLTRWYSLFLLWVMRNL
jgi:hypothetical protein